MAIPQVEDLGNMDGNIKDADYGWPNRDEIRVLQFAVTSNHLTPAEIVHALDRTGARVRLDSECVIAEIPADAAGNILSRMFTCHFMQQTAAPAI